MSPTLLLDWATWVPLLDASPGWGFVALPWVPYGGGGWIQLDARTVAVPQPAHLEIDTRNRTIALVERGRVRHWPVDVRAGAVAPRGRTLVLGEISVPLGGVDRGLLLAAHIRSGDHDAGLEAAGAHRWAVPVHDGVSTSGGVLVPPDAMTELLAAAPAGTVVLIH
ncbi:hypothetical protein [Actinokineospora sp. UTMC 2448]|uniref:hypothetical protein n=1 Tax=Actinokineospora sp. UTMC 2448 TaxID=2268449 RepID=UPI0021642854|nr:hypothetical protein [Actinokineospora sp. UTMC 2448]